MKKTIFSVLMLVLLLFSVLYGCKVKHKALKESVLKEHLQVAEKNSVNIIKSDSTAKNIVDTTKTIKKATEKTTHKKTTEIVIELDSGSKSFSADTGDISMTKMIKDALKHAKSIRMKVEEEQTKEKNSEETENKHLISEETNLKKENAKKDQSSKQQKDTKNTNKEAIITKDSTIGINWIRLWPLLVLALIIGGFLLHRKLK